MEIRCCRSCRREGKTFPGRAKCVITSYTAENDKLCGLNPLQSLTKLTSAFKPSHAVPASLHRSVYRRSLASSTTAEEEGVTGAGTWTIGPGRAHRARQLRMSEHSKLLVLARTCVVLCVRRAHSAHFWRAHALCFVSVPRFLT